MAACKTLLDDRLLQEDLQCVVCLEPLQEARRFNCFHLLCSTCAMRHVNACLQIGEGEHLAFGPVFCPQCREVSYVWPTVGRYLPECVVVKEAHQKAEQLLLKKTGNKAADAAEMKLMREVGQKIDALVAKSLSNVRTLLKEERELQEEAFEWAADSNHVTGKVAFISSDWSKPIIALAALRSEFGEQVSDMIRRRASLTKTVERLYYWKWIHNAFLNAGAVKAWFQLCPDDRYDKESFIMGAKNDGEDDEEIELFLLSAIFRSHRPYPGAILPEQRVKPGQIRAELLWRSGTRGPEPGNFDWPVHAAFVEREGSQGRIAVADKNNQRVQMLDRTTGNAIEVLFRNTVIPRRVHCHGNMLLVSDEMTACVKVFEMETWKFHTRFGNGIFLCPTGVAEKSDGTLIYTDMDRGIVTSHKAQTFELEEKWTCRLLNDRFIPSPSYVSVDADDFLFLSDSQNNCVKVFKPHGGIVARFGDNHLCCPRGIVIDPLGHLFVLDADHHRIVVFNPYGKFLQELELPVSLEYPMSLDYLPQERLLLVSQCSYSSYNHCVMLFRLHYDEKVIDWTLEDKDCETSLVHRKQC